VDHRPIADDAELERVKNFLWHGNTHRAGELLDVLGADIDCLTEPTDRHPAFAAKLTEFSGYIRFNPAFICNYGERHRCGETIASSPSPPSTRSSAPAWSRSS
jgi:hypothetical protein